jgi:hypothetical protein
VDGVCDQPAAALRGAMIWMLWQGWNEFLVWVARPGRQTFDRMSCVVLSR